LIKVELSQLDLYELMQAYKFYIAKFNGSVRETELYFKLRDAYTKLEQKGEF